LRGELPKPALCLITDEKRSVDDNERNVHAAFDGGCRWVQLRHRRMATLAFFKLGDRLRTLCDTYGAALIVNDRIDVALAVGADGVHLPAAGLTPEAARRLVGENVLVGRSVHSTAEISALVAGPVDYFQFGPVFETASKRAFGAPQGIDELRLAVIAAAEKPLCAVGGITAANAAEVAATGARGIAVIGAIHTAEDVTAATSLLIDASAISSPR